MIKNLIKFTATFAVILFVGLSSQTTFAAPFVCDDTFYVDIGSSTTPMTLYDIDRSTNPFTYSPIGDNAHGFIYNALGYNPLDNHMYAIELNTNNLLRIDDTGIPVNLGPILGLPKGGYSGTITDTGKFILQRFTSVNTMYIIDMAVNPLAVDSTVIMSQNVQLPGISYNMNDGRIYGVGTVDDNLTSVDITTGVVTIIGPVGETQTFGAMYSTADGSIFGGGNSGDFYRFDTTTGLGTKLSDSPPDAGNDGANCVTANAVFESDIGITKQANVPHFGNFASGDVVEYQISVVNNGPFGASGIIINDIIPAGTTATWTCDIGGGAGVCENLAGVGDISETISLPAGDQIDFFVFVTTPANMIEATLSNTATIVLPVSVTDPDLLNNTSTVVLNNTAPFIVIPTVDSLTTDNTTPTLTGTYHDYGDPFGPEFMVTVNGVSYQLGNDPELTINNGVWSLDLANAPLILGTTYDVVVQSVAPPNSLPVDNTVDEVVITQQPPSSSGGGGSSSTNYTCKDETASNYSRFGRHKQSKCEYDETVVVEVPAEQPAMCPIFTQHMRKGDRDGKIGQEKQETGVSKLINEIKLLQTKLKELGFNAGPLDGVFGEKTEMGVRAFQQAHFAQVLAPWGLTHTTGRFYQSSERWMNEILGCEDVVTLDTGVYLSGK